MIVEHCGEGTVVSRFDSYMTCGKCGLRFSLLKIDDRHIPVIVFLRSYPIYDTLGRAAG